MSGVNAGKNTLTRPTPRQLEAAGCNSVRIVAEAGVEEYVNSCLDAGLDVLPDLARESFPPYQWPDLDWEMAPEIVARYLVSMPGIKKLQVGNEPDHRSPSSWTMAPTEYARLVRIVRDVAAKLGRRLLIYSAGHASGDAGAGYLEAAGCAGLIDVVCVHVYGRSPDPGWTGPGASFGYVMDLLAKYRRYGKRLAVTEYGARSDEVGEHEQARYLGAMARRLLAEGVESYLFAWGDDVGGYGLHRHDGSQKPAYPAVSEVWWNEPRFVLGFATLSELLETELGRLVPLNNERHNPENSDGLQDVRLPDGRLGLMVWRKSDNWTAFTDGYRTWINGPFGLQTRLNDERFAWELGEPEARDIIGLLSQAPKNGLETRDVSAIKLIGVHWDGGAPIPEGYDPIRWYQWEARYHIAKNWGTAATPAYGHGLMYHEVISRDGRAWITRPPEHVVWAAYLANPVGYMIKLDATKGQPPTDAQRESLERRLDFNRDRFAVERSQVWGHGEMTWLGNSTSCPGSVVRGWVEAYRSGQDR